MEASSMRVETMEDLPWLGWPTTTRLGRLEDVFS